MTLKSSGLWCDLCGNSILDGQYWNCAVNGKQGCHACEKCKVQHEEHQAAMLRGTSWLYDHFKKAKKK